MKNNKKSDSRVKRGKFIASLGSLMLIPFIGRAQTSESKEKEENNADYQILLKPDGTTVKVRRNKLEKSKKIQSNLSNSALKHWLKK